MEVRIAWSSDNEWHIGWKSRFPRLRGRSRGRDRYGPPALRPVAGRPVTDTEPAEAYRADALLHAHRGDPEFGHRFLLDAARAAREPMSERTAWRIFRDNGWWSAFGKRRGRGKNAKAGPPVHGGRVRRDVTADGPDRLWPADVTEHPTGEGKMYPCAVQNVFSGRIVGYSIDVRMRSRLAVAALEFAVACRGQAAGCVVHAEL